MWKDPYMIGCALFAIGGLIAIIAGIAVESTAAIVFGAIALVVAVGLYFYALWERKQHGPPRRRAVT